MQSTLIRGRWAAIGAAVAVSLGAGGIGISQATTSSGEMPIYIPIEPCRLADTRPAFQVGPRATPLGAAETYTRSGSGTVGDCTLPSGTTGLSLNVTAVNPTLPTFLTLFPADSTLPNASHLNPAPGQPPTPNAVNVDLDSSREFSIYNLQGTVHVIVDVVGYYDDHIHRAADLADEPGVADHIEFDSQNATSTPEAMVATEMRVPADGFVLVEVSGHWLGTADNSLAYCQLQKGAPVAIGTVSEDAWFYLNAYDDSSEWRHFAGHRLIPVSAADNPPFANTGQDFSFVCDEIAGGIRFDDLYISVLFVPTSYEVKPLTPA